ncbi:MAG: hypothetical protein OEW35_13355 [Gammaproteobacteria bacterium]|nr:hypothetical protein [Gammaproteobacteria bacterium]MDH4255379.1 hypothetical protein [Gammaproteobacteria bacterium]MDH5261376.1 hypothetical protein [Gammaproteobacteria bacterium]
MPDVLFLLMVFFLLVAFFLLAFFVDAFFVGAFFRDAFLAGAFFLLTDFLADFLLAFFLVLAFFLDTFFLLAFFFVGVFDRPVFLLDAAFLRLAAFFRDLLEAFLAGIVDSCRNDKRPELYIAGEHMEGKNQGLQGTRLSGGPGLRQPQAGARFPALESAAGRRGTRAKTGS